MNSNRLLSIFAALGVILSSTFIAYITLSSDKTVNLCEVNRDYSSCSLQCDLDNPQGCRELGLILSKGKSVAIDIKGAEDAFKKGCELEDADSCGYLGADIIRKNIFKIAPEKSYEYSLKGCQLGSGLACTNIATLYALGQYVQEDKKKAETLYKKASELEYKACINSQAEGCFRYANMIYSSLLDSLDYSSANASLEKACNLNSADGCRALAAQYRAGKTLKQDFSVAKALNDKACSLGDHESCIELAKMYSTGRTVSYDMKKSFSYYEKACILGDADICIRVADKIHSNLKDKDAFKKAEKYYIKSCDYNNSRGCRLLGSLYYWYSSKHKDNDIAAKMTEKGHKLLEKGCNLEDAQSCKTLGIIHEKGIGVNINALIAQEYYEKACALGEYSTCQKPEVVTQNK